MKYPPHSQNSLNTNKKITGNRLISPLALYFECGNHEISPHSQNSLNTRKKITGIGLISLLALYFECRNPVISTPIL